LAVQRRRHRRTESKQQPEERDDDQRRADSARQPPTRQNIDTGGDGEPEQNPEECGEEERMGEPDELRQEVNRDDERRGAKDIGASKSQSARSSRTIGPSGTLIRRRGCRLIEWVRHAFGPGPSECG